MDRDRSTFSAHKIYSLRRGRQTQGEEAGDPSPACRGRKRRAPMPGLRGRQPVLVNIPEHPRKVLSSDKPGVLSTSLQRAAEASPSREKVGQQHYLVCASSKSSTFHALPLSSSKEPRERSFSLYSFDKETEAHPSSHN